MRLVDARVDVRAADPDAVEVEWSLSGERLTWSVANRADEPVAVDAVAVVARLDPVVEPVRMLRHGYQSWSPTGVATFGIDQDPTRSAGVRSLPIGMHHADWEHAEDGELRSELVTALRDDTGALLVVGFLGDGTTTAPSGSGRRATGRTASSSGSRRSSVAPSSSRGSDASCTRS